MPKEPLTLLQLKISKLMNREYGELPLHNRAELLADQARQIMANPSDLNRIAVLGKHFLDYCHRVGVPGDTLANLVNQRYEIDKAKMDANERRGR